MLRSLGRALPKYATQLDIQLLGAYNEGALSRLACLTRGAPAVAPSQPRHQRHQTSAAGYKEEEESSPAKSSPGPYKEQVLNEVSGKFETSEETKLDNGFVPALNPSMLAAEKGRSYLLMNPVYTKEYMESIVPKHRPPQGMTDKAAYYAIQATRGVFDLVTRYSTKMSEDQWLTRVVYLETVAGVPGMVGAMIRHLQSLRLMRRDHGWIHTLLEEAENERMHLLTFMQLKQPSWIFRTMVLLGQGFYCNMFFFAYLASPSFCHRVVGYLEEEAVRTYTHMLHDIDAGDTALSKWATAPAPPIAIEYWRLPQEATMRDLVLAVRADEACHSHVNHTFAGMKPDETNPFGSGNHEVP